MNIKKTYFGQTPDKEDVFEYQLSNDTGFSVKVINYGGIITEIMTPDKAGTLENVVLGFDSIEQYIDNDAYFGALTGRTAGRFFNACFELNGVKYQLAKNNKGNNLHGGEKGFSRRIWDVKEILTKNTAGICLSYRSKDMEEGFPGNLDVEAIYTIDRENRLTISYRCTSDKDTLAILTNHSYFNLSGNVKRSALEQSLKINASKYVTVDPYIIPIETCSVEGTPFDLRTGRVIKEAMDFDNEQIKNGKGYDHVFVLEEADSIVLKDEESGRQLDIETTEPCVVFYAGGYIGDEWVFRGKIKSKDYDGICLETQWYTDAMNGDFPKRILKAGEVFESQTKYTFRTIK